MMKSFLKISLVQADLAWENPGENRVRLDKLMSTISTTDLIILPEMFSTGFTMNTSVAEENQGSSLAWLKKKSAELDTVICGSLAVRDGENVFNRMYIVYPDGTHLEYDKRHLFRMAREHEHYSPGTEKIIAEVKGWKICPLVCYDLRFPVWSRNRFDADGNAEYDLLLYVANWPEKRRLPWNKLLPARGIENLAYVAGVNRVGVDGNGISYSGDSAVYDYTGFRLSNMEPFREVVETVSLDRDQLVQFRKSFPAYRDADDFIVK